MQSYEAVAVRSGKWWTIEVPALRLGFSQARRLSQVEAVARDMISLLTETDKESIMVTVRVDVPEADTVAAADRLRAQAEQAKLAADEATREAAVALVARNIPVRDIATLLHVSPAWVSVLTKDAAA